MWPILALQQLAAPVPKIALALTGCTKCRPGDRFKVDALVTNPNTTNVPIEAKLGVRAPGDISVSLIGQCLVFPLPGSARTTVPLLDITLPPGLPEGSWTFEGALLEPDFGVTLWRSVQPFAITK